jgi:hypothetical protein
VSKILYSLSSYLYSLGVLSYPSEDGLGRGEI